MKILIQTLDGGWQDQSEHDNVEDAEKMMDVIQGGDPDAYVRMLTLVPRFIGEWQKPLPNNPDRTYTHIVYVAEYPAEWELARCKAHFRTKVRDLPEYQEQSFKIRHEYVSPL